MADDHSAANHADAWAAPVAPTPLPSPDPVAVLPADGPLRVAPDRRPAGGLPPPTRDLPRPTSPSGPPPGRRDRDLPDAVRALLDTDGTAIVVIGDDGAIEHVNGAMLSLLGADSIDELTEHGVARGVLRSFLDHLPRELLERDRGTWQGDVDHRAPDGEHRLLRATVLVGSDIGAASPDRVIALLLHDVTDERQHLARLRHRATHDALTGLANRPRILDDLARAINHQRSSDGHVAAMFVDLDHLKYINDAFGHRIGDQLISSTAQRLSEAVRPSDRVARIGGDEFVVISTEIDEAITALELAERIRRALTGHLRIGDLDVEFSVSVGIALTDPDVFDHDDDAAASILIGNADTAMYEAKKAGRGRCTLFTSQMRSAGRERAELAAALARSVAGDDLVVDYQPVFSTVTKSAVGAEALVRWIHPTRGRLEPTSFIAVAEESGLIAQLGEQVLGRALDDLRQWIDADLVSTDFNIHVNVSRVQLGSASFVNLVLGRLHDAGIDAGRLVLEARDTSLLGRVADVDRSIRALRRAGVQIAVDNFGTGPKALAVMTDVGADVLKLDGSLALPSGSSDDLTRLVRAVVMLAHALDMRVVAERVSGFEQLHRLRAAGCDMVQGNLLAPAVPAAEIAFDAVIDW